MQLDRRELIAALALTPLASATTAWPGSAFAAAFPERPIYLIVPFAPGGNADINGRIVADVMAKALNGTIVVENKAGAGGGVGAEYVAHATPDGYTLLVGSNGPLTVNPFIHAHLGYDPLTDLVPIALASYVPHALIMSNQIEAKTVAEVVAMSKKAPVTIATSGVGSATHMTLERFKAATGADITHVPYRGGGALLPDLIGDNVNGAMTELSTALSLHQSGRAHIVAVAALRRSSSAPDVPTFDESGVKGFTAQSFVGILAPAKTPDAIITVLQDAVIAGLRPGSPAIDKIAALGAEIATPEQMTAKGFAAFIRADYEAMGAAAKLAGITPT